MIGIYKITSPNGRVYIGQSINIDKRFNTYFKMNKANNRLTKLYRSFIKYGIHLHTFEVILECNILELNNNERYYQELYNCVENGLNCKYVKTNSRSGAVGEETLQRMRKAQRGKTISKEARINMSSAKIGKKHTEETKLKMSSCKKNKPSNNDNSKIVLNVITGIYYNSLKDASESVNIKYSTLKTQLYRKSKNSSNFIYI